MKIKYVESVIVMLPDFNGIIASKGGTNYKQVIQWFKTDEETDFISLNNDESFALLNLIDSKLKLYLKDSVIKEMDEDNKPILPYYYETQMPCDYKMSKICDCKQKLGFEVKGFIPDLYEL